MGRVAGWLLAGLSFSIGVAYCADGYSEPLPIPKLSKPPVIDGDLSEWKYYAFSDGVWDLFRVLHSPWYDPAINRLTDHGNEPSPEEDLSARYYTAWDDRYLYFGAEVRDNVNDVEDPNHSPARWMFKDAICWFIEAPRHGKSKKFGVGDNAFCFIADPSKPSYGAWWRHGTAEKTYVEEPMPAGSVDYTIRLDPWKRGTGDFILEARVEMAPTLGVSDPDWRPPAIGDEYGMEIVHTDPDGGGYGAHLLIYGKADDDATWGRVRLVGPIEPVARKPR
ncbi:MAG: sugar-binding protein [bacterium]|jgi:hypothetical protein